MTLNKINNFKIISITIIIGLSLVGIISIQNSSINAQPSITQTKGKIMVLFVDGIKGNVLYQEALDTHEIVSFSWGSSRTATSSNYNRLTSQISFEDLYVIKYLDYSSPNFLEKYTKGEVITNVKLSVYIDGNIQWEYELTNVLITSIFTGGSGLGNDLESISFNYHQISLTAWQYDDTGGLRGSQSATWNLDSNSP